SASSWLSFLTYYVDEPIDAVPAVKAPRIRRQLAQQAARLRTGNLALLAVPHRCHSLPYILRIPFAGRQGSLIALNAQAANGVGVGVLAMAPQAPAHRVTTGRTVLGVITWVTHPGPFKCAVSHGGDSSIGQRGADVSVRLRHLVMVGIAVRALSHA